MLVQHLKCDCEKILLLSMEGRPANKDQDNLHVQEIL